jgi:hypothetical protein
MIDEKKRDAQLNVVVFGFVAMPVLRKAQGLDK